MAESNVRRLPVVVGVFLALVVLNLPGALHAQVTGTISGYVTDPSGAAVPQVKVTATLVNQNVIRITESNAEGFYHFPALLPGSYTLTAEKSAFQRLTQTDVVLTVNQNVRLDMALQLGAITQTEIGRAHV